MNKPQGKEIRSALISDLQKRHSLEELIMPEFGLCCGQGIADVAVISKNRLVGYEIKGETDNLKRLSRQIEVYNKVFDFVYLVTTTGQYIYEAFSLCPDWWGLVLAHYNGGRVVFESVREAEPNPVIDPYSVAQLLWRSEALSLLKEIGAARGSARLPRYRLWAKLANLLNPCDLRFCVAAKILARESWRKRIKAVRGLK